jgi:hypothetical protein
MSGIARRAALGAALAFLLAACAGTAQRAPEPAEQAPAGEAPEAPPAPTPPIPVTMNDVAIDYVKLVLALGERDPGYVDAYYGPGEWKEQAAHDATDAADIGRQAQRLIQALDALPPDPAENPTADAVLLELRKRYLRNQLGALSARAAVLQGLKLSFDDEARALYDVAPPHYAEADFEPVLKELDKLLPQEPGTLSERYNRYMDRYAVPRDKLDAVMRAAIGEARQRAQQHLALPPGEHFELAFVTGKPWSAYNWYQGGYASRIEVNTDQPIGINRVIQLASHEGYPGHHVYNALLEQALVRQHGWPEYQVYALYSPQSFIAEGSADCGMDLAFPGPDRLAFERQLFKLAGLPVREVVTYDRIAEAGKSLGPAVLEGARRYLDGQADAEATKAWLERYALYSPSRAAQRLAFFDQYRSYIVNYSYGEELVRRAVEKRGGAMAGSDAQWAAFQRLLSTPRVPSDLDD